MLTKKKDDLDVNVRVDDQPSVKPLHEAAEAAQQRYIDLCAQWSAEQCEAPLEERAEIRQRIELVELAHATLTGLQGAPIVPN